jgi:hypothetical protein
VVGKSLASADGSKSAPPLACKVWHGPSPSWCGRGAAAGRHGVAALQCAVTQAAVLWSGGCVADGVAARRCGGGREGRGDGRRRRCGLPFAAASLHLLGLIHRLDLGYLGLV